MRHSSWQRLLQRRSMPRGLQWAVVLQLRRWLGEQPDLPLQPVHAFGACEHISDLSGSPGVLLLCGLAGAGFLGQCSTSGQG